MTKHHARIETTLGELLLVVDETSLHGVYFPHHWKNVPGGVGIGAVVSEDQHAVARQAAREIREFLAGARTFFDLEIVTDGDPFSEAVWARLRAIPYGATISYGHLARSLDEKHQVPMLNGKSLAQRVGSAVGRNPLSIVVPCHRVIGGDGSLKGYAGGVGRKRSLLELEQLVRSARARRDSA